MGQIIIFLQQDPPGNPLLMSSIISLTVQPDVECLLIAGSSQENFSGRLYMGHARNLMLTLWENQRFFKQSSIKNVFIMPKKTPATQQ